MLTVKELIDGLDIQAVAGKDSLDTAVRWIHISELEDPTPWLSGGELLLTTGIQLGSAAKQTALVKQLAEKGAAGLGFGVGFDHETVPEAIIKAADKHGLAVLEVPYDVPFIAITEKAFAWLVNEQYAVLRQALSGHAQLENVVLNEGGLTGIAEVLATLIGCSVRIFGLRGELLVESAFNQPLEPAIGAEIRDQLEERLRAGHFDAFESHEETLPGRTLVLPVPATGEGEDSLASPQAWLAAVKDNGGLTELDRLTFHQAITIVALELLRMRVAEDTEQRLAGNVLADIVSGDLLGNELARRLEPFGISDRVSAIVVAPEQPDPEILSRCKQSVSAALRDEVSGALIATSGPLLCALTAGLDDKELHATALRISKRVTEETKVPVMVGVGRQTQAGQARRAYHEARWAIEARVLSANGNEEAEVPDDPVASYKDLGSFQLLLALQDDEALRLFCDSVLAPIEAGEGHYGDELLRSLEAFIEENGQWERAARRLYCHRHTLRYRVKKIEELTGRDLQSARDRIEFWLALRGRELVH